MPKQHLLLSIRELLASVMLRVVITGASGLLGRTLMSTLKNMEIIPLTSRQCDITKYDEVASVLKVAKPNVIIHCAAFTAVDDCEVEKEKAWSVNVTGSRNIAQVADDIGAKVIAISSDYVFNGKLNRPYNEYDIPDGGLNVYSKTKWEGEKQVQDNCRDYLIARTSWLYGSGGPSFLHTMLRLSRQKLPTLRVVNDQVGNPTSAESVARALQAIIKYPELTGVIHLTCEGEATWFEFAKKIFELRGESQLLVPCSTQEYPTRALRPRNSRLEKLVLKETGIFKMPTWTDALRDFLSNEKI